MKEHAAKSPYINDWKLTLYGDLQFGLSQDDVEITSFDARRYRDRNINIFDRLCPFVRKGCLLGCFFCFHFCELRIAFLRCVRHDGRLCVWMDRTQRGICNDCYQGGYQIDQYKKARCQSSSTSRPQLKSGVLYCTSSVGSSHAQQLVDVIPQCFQWEHPPSFEHVASKADWVDR